MQSITGFAYILASVMFILGLKMLGKLQTARNGNILSACGMLLAVIVTLLDKQIISYKLIVVGIGIGALIGYLLSHRVKMTAMPEMVALLNGLGGLASLLVGVAEYYIIYQINWNKYLLKHPDVSVYLVVLSIFAAIIIGGITFSGSIIAYLKLGKKIPSRGMSFKFQNIFNVSICFVIIFSVLLNILLMDSKLPLCIVICVTLLSLILGVTITLPIGGGDMPVVISLLNSLSGLAASAAGFIVMNSVLIVAGCLVGASGIILTIIMCKSMNRSLISVLFKKFGNDKQSYNGMQYRKPVAISVEDAYFILESARSIVFIPGYGMAIAQAQYAVKELSQILEDNGADVQFAIHPVAGRMPGHMNVLLAEANIEYDKLIDIDTINRNISTVDVAVVIGANDVVNPAAVNEKGSPIYGMPIINAHLAKNVLVLKRGNGTGFSGLENQLFSLPNTRVLFGDAKQTLNALVSAFKE